jgi:hypothetical protein
MTLPVPFQIVIDRWESQGIHVTQADWTTGLRRHVGARVKYKGNNCYAKLAIAKSGDLDESEMLSGIRREVWWSGVIQRLRQENAAFPFTSPRVLATNVGQQPFQEKVAWLIMEYIDGVPVVDWEPEQTERQMNKTEDERFDCLFDDVISSLIALEQVHPDTLDWNNSDLPPLPSPPHGMRRWQKKGLLDMETAVLGNGAFEIKNFWRTPSGQLVIMDNEFAGWYPKYDHLSYLYHRLYCNTARPDLAKRMLDHYMKKTERSCDLNSSPKSLLVFWKSFAGVLRPRLLSGWYYDTVRRKLMPWHEKQRLRYGLLWSLLCGRYDQLVR